MTQTQSQTQTVAEIVTFRLAPDTDAATFAKAAAVVERKFRDTGGMLARTLSRTADGGWTDHIVWASQAAADRAAREVMQSDDCAPFMALIDPGSVTLTHGDIARRMD